jgi:flagellar basal-body rod modification protein FlgD
MTVSFSDYANQVAASTGIKSGGQTVAEQLESARTTLTGSQQSFLTLLTSQLKNQDPLNPTDSTQFVQQTVQMTGVQQQLLTNNLLTALVGQSDQGLKDGTSMLGKTVTAGTAGSYLKDGKADWTYNLAGAADSVKIDVVNAAGTTVYSTTMPASEGGKGEHAFTWNGKNANGSAQPSGVYALKITATNGGASVSGTIEKTGVATGVTIKSGSAVVTIDGVDVPLSAVTGVKETVTAANSSGSATS